VYDLLSAEVDAVTGSVASQFKIKILVVIKMVSVAVDFNRFIKCMDYTSVWAFLLYSKLVAVQKVIFKGDNVGLLGSAERSFKRIPFLLRPMLLLG
jgi:hypothetical protein